LSGDAVATSTLTYSADVVRRAARTFFRRRLGTLFGAQYLGSFPLMGGFAWSVYSIAGANWVVGAIGLLLTMNLMIQVNYYVFFPRIFAKLLSDPAARTIEVETFPDGIRIVSGRNAALLTWAKYKHIWIYDAFIIMAKKPPLGPFHVIPTEGMTPEVRHDLEAASRATRQSPPIRSP
jgi:hypothetical protein